MMWRKRRMGLFLYAAGSLLMIGGALYFLQFDQTTVAVIVMAGFFVAYLMAYFFSYKSLK